MAGREMERAIQALARKQHGVVTRAQLITLGIGPRAVSRRAESGVFRRLHRGTYLVGPIAPPWSREMAAALACAPAAAVSHRSAAGLWKVGRRPDASSPVDITVAGRRGRGLDGIRAWCVTTLADDEWTRIAGIPVTTLGRTLVDFAAVAPASDLERAVARAERESLITPDGLDRLLERYRGRPGNRALRAVLARAGGPALTESEAETIFLRDVVREGDLPTPKVNAMVAGYRLDVYWPEHGVAVEIDGFRWHSSRPSFDRDRHRITRLAAAGIQVIPVTYRQITERPTATAVQIGQALVRAEQDRRA